MNLKETGQCKKYGKKFLTIISWKRRYFIYDTKAEYYKKIERVQKNFYKLKI